MQNLIHDIRFAVRTLVKSPAYAWAAILSLALCIGANTTIFSLFNTILLRPLPGANPDRLVTVYTSDFSGPLYGASSYPDYVGFRDRNEVFSGLAAYKLQPFLLTKQSGESFRALGAMTSSNYLDVLGLASSAGRFFLPAEDDNAGQNAVVVLSYGLWQKRFGGNTAVVGRPIHVNSKPFTVVGIAPQGFAGLTRGISTELWTPLSMAPVLTGRSDALTRRGTRGLFIIGRLGPGATLESAKANMDLIGTQLYLAYPQNWKNLKEEPRRVSVLPESASRLPAGIRGPVIAFLSLLLVVVGLVLMIACANVANLQLARSSVRRREVAIRIAMGASRGRIVRQLLTESLLLALLAGSTGVLLALWATRLLNAVRLPLPVSLDLEVTLDPTVLVFTGAISLLTGLLFGLYPALSSYKPDQVKALKDAGGETAGYRRSWARSGLVIIQVSVTVMLLIGSALFLRSLANADAMNPGFDSDNVLLFDLDLDASGYEAARGRLVVRELQQRLRALPAVEYASVATRLPLDMLWSRRSVQIEDYQFTQGEDREVHFAQVGGDYFRALHVPMAAGRGFIQTDMKKSRGVVVVNEAFVRRYWPGRNPLGKRITSNWRVEGEVQAIPMEVIGMVRDGKYNSLGEDPTPFVFYPYAQTYSSGVTVILRTYTDPTGSIDSVRGVVRSLDANLPVINVRTMEEQAAVATMPARAAAWLLGVMGGLALVLAALGLYGVISYMVSQRTQEIGVRMALGADRLKILRLVVGQGMLITIIGTFLGLAAAASVTRFLTFLLYGISPLDPVAFGAIPALLGGIALVACWVPALRAANVDPILALRCE